MKTLSEKIEHQSEMLARIFNFKNITGAPEGAQAYAYFRRIEERLHRYAEIACERSLSQTEERLILNLLGQVERLLGKREKVWFYNTDPRGYALKISDAYMRTRADIPREFPRDIGGYGIIAPDFTDEG